MGAKLELLRHDAQILLVRVCLLDESGNEIPDTDRYIVFELPSWIQIFQSPSLAEAEKAFNRTLDASNGDDAVKFAGKEEAAESPSQASGGIIRPGDVF